MALALGLWAILLSFIWRVQNSFVNSSSYHIEFYSRLMMNGVLNILIARFEYEFIFIVFDSKASMESVRNEPISYAQTCGWEWRQNPQWGSMKWIRVAINFTTYFFLCLFLSHLLPCQVVTNDVNCFSVRHHLANKLFLMHIFAYLHINAFIMMISILFFSLPFFFFRIIYLAFSTSMLMLRQTLHKTSQRLMHIHFKAPIWYT